MYERCSTETCVNGVKCSVVEWVKNNNLMWFGHLERNESEEFVKKVYVSEIESATRKRRPVVRWKDRVKEYMYKRGADTGVGIEQARRKCLYSESWRLFCHGHTLGDTFPERMTCQKL